MRRNIAKKVINEKKYRRMSVIAATQQSPEQEIATPIGLAMTDHVIAHVSLIAACSPTVIARLDRAIQRAKLDYPVKPDNDNHRNRVNHV